MLGFARVVRLPLEHLLSLVCLSPVKSMIPSLIRIVGMVAVDVVLISMVTGMGMSMEKAMSIIIITIILMDTTTPIRKMDNITIILMGTTSPIRKMDNITIMRTILIASMGTNMGKAIENPMGMRKDMEKGRRKSMEEGIAKGTGKGIAKSMGMGVVLPMVGTNIRAAHQKSTLDQSQCLPVLQGMLDQCSSFIR